MSILHTIDFIFDIFGALLFVGAVSILLFLVGTQQDSVETAKADIYDTHVVYMQQDADTTKQNNTISYEDLCGILFGKLEYDVEIVSNENKLEIKASDFNFRGFDYDNIPKASSYICSYEYDNDGNLTKVLYTAG